MNKVILLLILSALVGMGAIHNSSSQQVAQTDSRPVTRQTRREQGRKIFQGVDGSQPKLTSLASSASTNDVGTELGVGLTVLTSAPPPPFHEALRNLICSSDAVVIGAVKSQSSHLTEDETFLYTDNLIIVEEVISNNAESPIEPNASLTVARTGGKIKLKGKNVSARDDAALPLEVGQRYLLFLSFIPERNTYTAIGGNTSFLLQKNKIINLNQPIVGREFQSGNGATEFLDQVRAAAANSCEGEVSGGTK